MIGRLIVHFMNELLDVAAVIVMLMSALLGYMLLGPLGMPLWLSVVLGLGVGVVVVVLLLGIPYLMMEIHNNVKQMLQTLEDRIQ